MIDFLPANISHKEFYRKFFTDNRERGCEYSFSNLILWGQQNIAEIEGCLVRLSYYGGHIAYAFPIGNGNKEKALNAVICDAEERGIPCVFMGVYEEDKALLESLFEGRFRFKESRDSFDYVYDINDLCDLSGRKFHSKRNHLHRFKEACPDFFTEEISQENKALILDFASAWYKEKLSENPVSDFDMEQIAISRAIKNYEALGMEGILLKCGEKILGFTMGSRLDENTFDIHFEKASDKIQGIYAAVNNLFANHLRDKYPSLRFLNREEDMGIEGLRRAKESYRPHHLVEKYLAFPTEASDEY